MNPIQAGGTFNWGLATPEIVLSLCAMAILMVGAIRKADSTLLCTLLGVGALLLTAMLVVATPDGLGYRNLFGVDGFARFMKLLVLVGSGLSLVLALDYNQREGIARFEFPVLILLCTVGMMAMCSATSLMTLYMGLELQSLSIYVLAAFARDELRSAEAGLKYFVLGALASGLLLYGISLTYGFSGTMQFAELGHVLSSPGAASAGPGRRRRVHHRRARVQAVGGAVPYVDARRVRGRAHVRSRRS